MSSPRFSNLTRTQAIIPSRAYWKEIGPFVTSEAHLTFELNAHEAWSFPRTQLIRFELTTRCNPAAPAGAAEEPVLELQFPEATMVVQTDYPQELLAAILAGRVSILSRGPMCERDSHGRDVPQQTVPPRHAKSANYVHTGPIETSHE